MSYSIKRITQVADCDVLLTWAAREKADLDFELLSEDRLTDKFETTSVEVEAILQGVLAELSALRVAVVRLPEGGKAKADMGVKIKKLEYKQFLLENRKQTYGLLALLQKELDIQRIENEIKEVDTFVAELTAHKATL
ncbi:hypothetical protein GJU43_18700 [Flavobacterium sp. LC2016-23]|uniref:hypothetical protein n=1 Tax=Flavobacterium sp. LC2016-23 TaxID=2666330 RepID=UPI0012AF4C6E|nr:hypothetical protein [Flavobacterium sp. LC2016-23]MRX41322.1 hypothetical protein [Flavobacterium sp. LC2016-23]